MTDQPQPLPAGEPAPAPPQGNGLAVAALVLGIVAMVFCWFPILNWILAVLGIVFGAVGNGKANKVGAGKGMALAGLICGIVAFAVGTIIFFVALNAAENEQQRLFDSQVIVVDRADLRA